MTESRSTVVSAQLFEAQNLYGYALYDFIDTLGWVVGEDAWTQIAWHAATHGWRVYEDGSVDRIRFYEE